MSTKTFKIGEYCKGGVITVIISPLLGTINVICKEWDSSTGCKKSSNQSKAKEITSKYFIPEKNNCYRDLSNFLCNLTTSYYSNLIIDWIETKVKINKE